MTTETRKIETLKAHLAINVRDVEQSIEFYKKMFGIEPSKIRTGYAKFDVANPPLNFTLNQVSFGERGALSHMGIQVASTEDVLAMREQWHQQGLITRDEMQTDCCYATQDKTWVYDPDGNEWEVFVVLKDNLPEAQTSSNAACCAPAAAVQQTASSAEQKTVEDSSCGCEVAPPAVGEAACCETQAAKFGIAEIQSNAAGCCAPAPVSIGR
jgi:catechol 2,3-dioxygenase-like lactoylglutathione lyase family enzyme